MKTNKKNGCGRKPLYPELEEIVFSKLLEVRNFGAPVNYAWIRKCSIETFQNLNPDRKDNLPSFSDRWIVNFLARYDLTIRKASSQRIEKNTDLEIILTYQEEINHLIEKYKISSTDIFNMDETALFFDLSPDYTVDRIGSKRVSIVKNYAAKTRCTCVLTIRSNGDILDPMVIFKGKNLTNNLKNGVSGINSIEMLDNAWMNQTIMEKYIDSLPASESYKLLIMDTFAVHKNNSILEKLLLKRYIVVFVPPGYTDILQPLDVSINKPFKSLIRKQFQNWIDSMNYSYEKLPVPTKDLMCKWIALTKEELSRSVIANSFEAANIILFTHASLNDSHLTETSNN